jgi:non-ribosomal peptide synthetase component F
VRLLKWQYLSFKNERANRLAHYLQLQGVGAEVLVGLHLERSPLLIIGLLGIHKARGAYVPLDPDFPSARLAFMVRDAKMPVRKCLTLTG